MVNFDELPKAQELKSLCGGSVPFGEFVFETMLKESKVALLHGVAFGRPLEELSYRLSFTDFDGEKLLQKAETQEIDEEFIKEHCEHLMAGLDSLINFWVGKTIIS